MKNTAASIHGRILDLKQLLLAPDPPMPRIPETNVRYRKKEEIAKDIAFILQAPIAYGTKYAVLSDATWTWTEFHGKYEGCPYWTQMAFMQYCVNRKSKLRHRNLRHEHAIPKRVVINKLFGLENPTPETVLANCDKYLIGVIVTCEEDAVLNEFRKTMPLEFDDPKSPSFDNPWLRYERCNIKALPMAGFDFENLTLPYHFEEPTTPAQLLQWSGSWQRNNPS